MKYMQMVPGLRVNTSKSGAEKYSSLARKLKGTKIIERVNDDALFMLTYMAAISTADIERNKIFDYAGRQKEYEASKYFRQIHILSSKWGYEYSKACKYTSQKLNDVYFSKFLERIAGILSSGEPEKNFLKQEKSTREEIYSSEYERSVELLKKWTDGYTALMVSMTLIVTIILVSVMIYKVKDIETVIFLIEILTLVICGLALYIIYKAAPDEKKVHTLERKSKEQQQIEFLSRILLPLGTVFLSVLIFLGTRPEFILLGITIFTLPIGILAMVDDRKIDERDSNFPIFIRTLGTLAGTTGITIRNAMENLDAETVGCLKPEVGELNKSLSMGFNYRLCWEKFIGETGSELINRCSRIFTDAVKLGGDPAEIGNIISASCMAVVLLRMKRQLVSSGFKGLAITLHAVMIGLLIFIIEIISKFSSFISRMSGVSEMGMSMFNMAESMPMLYKFTFSVIVIITVSNAFVVKIVEGGGNYKLFFYGGLMSGISGFCMILIPPVVSKVFAFQI